MFQALCPCLGNGVRVEVFVAHPATAELGFFFYGVWGWCVVVHCFFWPHWSHLGTSIVHRAESGPGWINLAGSVIHRTELPELVVIAFVVPISPLTAFVIALITIYNNALVFSLYSYFLPKDKHGKFLMPKPITEAGTQILTAGAAMGLILFMIFGVYVYKLVVNYAEEEQEVRETLEVSPEEVEQRLALANAFGGITQVMFLVLPFTLLSIAIYQGFITPDHPGLPIHFTLSNIFLLIFLFPTFFVLVELIEEDHTLGILDATIMTAIILMLIMLLVTYGADGSAGAG